MRRTLAWSLAMSTVVAVAITFMLNSSPRQRGHSEHGVQVVVSLLGRSVTIGVSVNARQHALSTHSGCEKIGSEIGEAP